MGLYYNPPNPNIGRQQPLEPIKLDPPQSGPPPQNPPFAGAAAMALGAVLIAAWPPPPPGPNLGNAQPYAHAVLSPPISVPQNPPFNGGAKVSREILIDWIAPPPDPFMGRWQPLEARKLVPPQSAPSVLPVGAPVPQAVLVWWVPPAPGPNQGNAQPYAQQLLSPPISGPAPQNPPFMGGAAVREEILIDWIPPPPAAIVARNLIPKLLVSDPPFASPNVPLPVLNWWIPPPPQAPVVGNLVPPISVPQNPPFVGGAQIPNGLLNTWIPPDPAFQSARNLPPPLTVSNPPLIGGRVSQEILRWWVPPDPMPVLPGVLPPQPVVVAAYLAPNRLPLQWPAPDPMFQAGSRLVPPQSGPAPQNPPFPETKVATEIQVSWLPAPPQPITGPLLVQGAAQAAPPPVRGTAVPLEVQVAWIPPPPLPTLWPPFNAALAPIGFVPPACRPMVEVAINWLPLQPAAIVARNLTPLSNPVPVPLAGSFVPQPVMVWWSIPVPPQPPVTPPAPVTPANTPPFMGGASLPYPVTAWWNIPPPMYQVAVNLKPPQSGPLPQNPPFMGGAKVPLAVLVDWIPPPPQPPAAWTATQAFQPPPGALLRVDLNFVTWPPARVSVTTPLARAFATYQPSRVTVTAARIPGMPRGNDFSTVDPSETVTNTWDFGPWLGTGVTLSTPVTSCSLLTGADSAPSSRLIGAPQVTTSPTTKVASQAVLQQVQGMQNNATYILLCTVNTSDGQVLTLYAHQLCQGPT